MLTGNSFVTIIIPVYKDWARLSLCLTALSNQSFPKESFEIIVVNNNQDEKVPEDYIIPLNCSIIHEKKRGSYAARNSALKLAKGEIIGFTDSDCIPDKDWIKNAVEHFEHNKSCIRIAGNVRIFFRSSKPTKIELYEKYYAFNQSRYVCVWGTSVTANLFTYKHVFDKVGLFNENLMSGGDWNWGIIAHKSGYKIDYVENVIVQHPARHKLAQLVQKELRIGGGHGIFLPKSGSMPGKFYKFLKALLPKSSELKYIHTYGKDLSIHNKIHFFFIRYYLLSARAFEKFRVQTGRKPKRV